MFRQESTRFIVKLLFILFCTCSTIPEVKTAGAVAEVRATAAALAAKMNGDGVIERIRNFTEYFADISMEEIVHDQLPNGTTGRIKCANGTYLVCKKVGDVPTVTLEKCEDTDPNALWTFNRIKDETLHDWIGICHPNSDGKYLGVDPKTGQLTFPTKDLRPDSKAVQWEVFGKKITEFFFRNRLTGGVLHQRTDEIEVLKTGEADREETSTAQDSIAIGQGAKVITGYDLTPVTFVDDRGGCLRSNLGPAWFLFWHPMVRTDDVADPFTISNVMFTHQHNRDHKQDLHNGLDVRLYYRHSNTLFVMRHGDWNVLNSPNWGDWERFCIRNKGRFATDGIIHYGNLVGIHSVPFGHVVRLEGNIYKGGAEDPANSHFYAMPSQLSDINQHTNVFRVNPDGAMIPMRGLLQQVAMQSNEEIYGVSHYKRLYKWNGSAWAGVPTSFRPRQVSISAKGDLCCVDVDDKLWLKQDDGWVLFASKVRVAAIRSKSEIWYVDTDGVVARHNGVSADKFPLPNANAAWISVSDSGAVWATDATKDRSIWRFKPKDKDWLQIPGAAYRVAVRTETDVWVIGIDGRAYHYEKNAWVPKGVAYDISVASGISTKKFLGAREKKLLTFLTVLEAGDKPHGGSPAAQMGIEIEKLGMGGGIGPKVSIDFGALPASQHPRVSGFAVDRIEDFDPASILSVNPMISKGAAWLETSLPKPSVGGVSFMLRVRDAGDAQIVFGQEMSNSFAYKVIFGGWGNTKSAIVKREFKDGKPVDTVVFELPIDTYPMAYIPSGSFLPYWVSINNGLILAGMGDFGANIFLAWRDPKPVPKITRVGFGSHKAPVQFNNIKITPPAVFSTVPRVYVKSAQKISPDAAGGITWSNSTFRMYDRGSVQIAIQGTKSAAVILARKKNAKSSHYAIVFGDDDNTAITIKKWHTGQRRYNERARIKLAPLPDLKLDGGKRKSYWVSYYFGQIVIGTGDIGANPLYVFQDLAAVDGIDSVGFANFGGKTSAFGSLQIGSPLALRTEQQEQSYDKTSGPTPFGGGLTIILPFDYEFSQEGQAVKLTDYVLNASYYLGATPQQGAIYPFQVTIQPNGMPTLDWTRQPENKAQLELQKAVVRVKNQADLDAIEAAKARAQGQIEKDLKLAAGEQKRAQARDLAKGGEMLTTVGAVVMGAAGAAGPIFGGIAIGIGAGIAAGGVGMTIAAAAIGATAADRDYEGAELLAVKQRQANEIESNANRNKQLADGAASEATVGIRGHDSYVFLDKPGAREAMGSQSTSEAAKKNRADAAAKLEEAVKIRPTTLEDMIKLSLLYKDFVMLANQSAVLSGDATVKERFLAGADALLTAYLKMVESGADVGFQLHQDLLTFLLNAYNNPYLLDELKPNDAKMKDSWYWMVTIFGRQLVAATDARAITIDHFYGEYCWLDEEAGFVFPEAGSGIVAFEARGTDILVCLAEEKARIRNSETEVYEVCFGGWDNTKTALRLKSLDRYVAVTTKKENPKAMTDPTAFRKYWVSCADGLINVGCGAPGEGTVLTWQDPYPNKKVKAIGLSGWNSRVEFRNIGVGAIGDVGDIAAAEKAAATVDDSASFVENTAKLQQIADAFNASEAGEATFNSIKEAIVKGLSRDNFKKVEKKLSSSDGFKKLTAEELAMLEPILVAAGFKEEDLKSLDSILTPDVFDKKEIAAIDIAIAAANQREGASVVQLQKFKSAIDSIQEDISDADHIEALTAIATTLGKDIEAAKGAAPAPAAAPEKVVAATVTSKPVVEVVKASEKVAADVVSPATPASKLPDAPAPGKGSVKPVIDDALAAMEAMGAAAAA